MSQNDIVEEFREKTMEFQLSIIRQCVEALTEKQMTLFMQVFPKWPNLHDTNETEKAYRLARATVIKNKDKDREREVSGDDRSGRATR